MVKRPKSDGRCIHCRERMVKPTKDHVFPDSWYPMSTSSKVQRWTAPSCGRCNHEFGEMEKELFVRLALCDRLRVLQVSSVVRLVGFNGHPAVLPDKEMEALRTSVTAHLRAEPHPYLTVGRRVRVKSGPLAGVEGILIRKKNAFRVVLSLDFILRSAAVEVDAIDLERI